MRATLNDALVHWTLHPPKIPRISSAGPSKAGSTSASSADCGGASPVVPRSQYQASTAPFSSSTQQGRKRQERKGTVRLGGSGRSGGKCQNAGVKVVLTVFRLCCGWGACLSAPWGALAVSWSCILDAVRPVGRIPHPLQGFFSSPPSHLDIVSDILG